MTFVARNFILITRMSHLRSQSIIMFNLIMCELFELGKDDLSGHFEPHLASSREMPLIAYDSNMLLKAHNRRT